MRVIVVKALSWTVFYGIRKMSVVVNETEYLTQGGLAELFRVSVRTMQRLARERGFPRPLRFGRSYRWRKAEVEEFLRKTRQAEAD